MDHSNSLFRINRLLVNLPLADPAVKGRSQAPGLIVLQVLRGRARQLEPF